LQPILGFYSLQRRLQGQRPHLQVAHSTSRAKTRTLFHFAPQSASFVYRSDLAALHRPRIIVLDTTFAHHSWDFEPQVSSSLPLACAAPASQLHAQLRAAAALADRVSAVGPKVVIATDM